MQYISIDIETTGLDPATCQILEIAAIYDDGVSPVEKLPRFRVAIHHDRIEGESYALAMNCDLLKEIASGGGTLPESAVIGFRNWVNDLDPARTKPFPIAGKNVGSFDYQFLKQLPDFPDELFDHRFIDVGCLYLTPKDRVIPSQKYCLRRAGLPDTVTHQAMDDALQVVQLIRAWEEKNS